ncbi:MAG: membrane protein insertase YidC [Pseudohongiellaceae bacterium]
MNYTRFVLFTGLAIVSYLLLLAWQADYPPTVSETTVDSTGLEELDGTPASNDDLPTQLPSASSDTTAGSTAANDLPTIPGQEDADAESVPRGQTVNVRTDTFDLRIDLNGGDISYLALPQFLRDIDVENDPFVMLQPNSSQRYVAQSGLIGPDGIDGATRATYTSRSSEYVMAPGEDSLTVDLVTSDDDGVQVTKRFTFDHGSYLIEISYLVENPTASPWTANMFGQISRDPFDDPSSVGGFGRSYLGFATTSPGDPYIRYDFGDVEDGIPSHEMEGGWIAFSQHYFLSAWIPDPTRVNNYSFRINSQNQYVGSVTSTAFQVPPQTSSTQSLQFYAGPKDQYALAEVSENLDLTIDYGFLWFLAQPIYWLLTRINGFVGNYGLSIILLTVVVKGLFYKLTETQYKSMAGMRRVMPKMQQLKERYSDDKMQLQKATMELYKKEKINPFGGCLPMLVQMPVFIALYWVLMEGVELRHAPFFLWINDLSVRDPFFVLPILMGASMYAQFMLSPPPPDPMQAKVMKLMPIMMTVFFLWFPAGLVLYWLVNSVLGILQQWYITRKLEKAYEAKKA